MITEASQGYSGAVLAGADLKREIARLRKSNRNAAIFPAIAGTIFGFVHAVRDLPRQPVSDKITPDELDSSVPRSSEG
jgi:hypothetical protein